MTARIALLATILAAAAAAATPATAQTAGVGIASDAFVDQVGEGHAATIVQQGIASAAVRQQGRNQTAAVVQRAGGGGRARLRVDMSGWLNDATVTQGGQAVGGSVADLAIAGTGNVARVSQYAIGGSVPNTVALVQQGIGNYADLSQRGSGNAIDLRQDRNDNRATIAQDGTGLAIKMVQTGGATASVVQTNR